MLVEVAQIQPLRREVVDQRLGALVGQHAAHLLLEHRGVLEAPVHRGIEQLVVGNAAPQEERQPRRQLEIVDAIGAGLARCPRSLGGGGLALDAEQERRARQHRAQRHLDAVLEAAVGAPLLVEAEKRLHLGGRRRTPIRAARQRGENRLRARRLVARLSPGRHEKMRLRLGVSPMPLGLNGPAIDTL